MNGPQDLGGRRGFGPVAAEPDEPLFHAPWEARALGLTLCAGALGHWTLDESRHARESLPPATYLSASYYEIWIRALETLLQRHGEVTAEELASGTMQQPGLRPERKLPAGRVPFTLLKGGPVTRDATTAPRFQPGDAVRTILDSPATHTRLPDYARDKPGVIEAHHGAHVFPDTNAHGQGEQPQHLYTVCFDGADLFGADAKGTQISIDAWEPYLVPA